MLIAGCHTILVSTDFSDASEPALSAAMELARVSGASIEVLHVSFDRTLAAVPAATAGSLPTTIDLQANAPDERQREQMDAAVDRVRRAGIRAEGNVSQGKTHLEIVERAVAVGAGLIVMGTHPRHGITHTLLGSVAEKVLRNAPCPVLVVPVLTEDAAQPALDEEFVMPPAAMAEGV